MSVDREYRIKIGFETNGSAQPAADQLHDVGRNAEKASDQMEGLNGRGREFHELVSKLNTAVPGLGNVLKIAFNPEVLGVEALIIGIEAIKGALESYEKKLEEAAAAAEKADFSESFEAAAESAKAAVAAADEYQRKLEDIQKAEQSNTAELSHRLELMAAIQAAQENEAEAQKTLALARVQEDEAMGRVTHSQAIIQRGEIERNFVSAKERAEQEKFQKEQQARNAALNEAAGKQAGLDKAKADADAKLKTAQSEIDFAKSAPKIDAVREAQKKADEARETAEQVAELEPSDSNKPQIEQAAEAARRAQQAADNQQQLYNRAEQAAKLNIDLLKKDAEAKEKAAADNKADISKFAGELNSASRTEADPAVMKSRADAAEASRSAIERNTQTELINRGNELQKEFLEKGASMPHQQAAELAALLRQVANYIRDQNGNFMTRSEVKQEMQALRMAMESKGK